jgi:uridine phosphorylase
MLLLTFAVPHESRILRQTTARDSIRILHTGIGQSAAAQSLRRAFAEDRPSAVISSGFAGGLDPQLRAGDLVADTSHSQGDFLSLLPTSIHRGPIHTAAESIDSVAAKTALRHTSGAMAVDMESTAVAAECTRAGVPLLILRVISDAASDPIPVPLSIAWNLRMQRPRPVRLAAWLISHPTRILPFARFLQSTNLAARRLAEALPAVVTALEAACTCE